MKFKVVVEGSNFLIKFENARKKMGFFATRFIEAANRDDAEKIVRELIMNELRDLVLNKQTDPPIIFIEEFVKLNSFGSALVPGTGVTWYTDDEV